MLQRKLSLTCLQQIANMKKLQVYIFFLLAISVSFSNAVANEQFELDGDARATSRDDWSNPANSVLSLFNMDVDGANVFQNALDSQEISTWRWKHDTSDGVAGNLNLKSGFIAVYNNYASRTDQMMLYFGAVIAEKGPVTYAFWFLQSDITAASNGQFVGSHQDGDLLVHISVNKNAVESIRVYRWAGASPHLVQIYARDGESARCKSNEDQAACGIANAADIESYQSGAAKFPAGTFVEGGVNLNHFFPTEIPCFRSYLIHTQESISLSAQAKDFLYGNLDFCALQANMSCEKVSLDQEQGKYMYSGYVWIWNPSARIVASIVVKMKDEILASNLRLNPGEWKKIEFERHSSSHPTSVPPVTVSGEVGNKFPVVIFTEAAKCPKIDVQPALELTKKCEVQMAPYEYSSDGTQEVVVHITGTVKNSGNIDLEDVVVSDDDGYKWNFESIKAGETLQFSRVVKSDYPAQESYTDTVTATGKAIMGLGDARAAPVTAVCKGISIQPELKLEKDCEVKMVHDGEMQSVRVEYHIRVTNVGNVHLRNVTLVDDKGTPNDLSDDAHYGPIRLERGETMQFDGFYYPQNISAEYHSDTVKAYASTMVHKHPLYVAKPVTATCKGVKFQPKLELTKTCEAALVSHGQSQAVQVTFSGTVKNTGDVRLVNVLVTDDRGTADESDDFKFGPFSLAPNEERAFSQSYFPANPAAASHSDTVEAVGYPELKGLRPVHAAPVTATCPGIKYNKRLELTKRCTVVASTDLSGYRSWMLRIEGTVRNAGTIALENVRVFDDDDFTWNIGDLAAGQTKPFNRELAITDLSVSNFTDTVTATADAVAGLGSVDAAPVTATCQRPALEHRLALSKQCYVSLSSPGPAGERTVMIHFEIEVRNTGTAHLKEIHVTDDHGTPSDASDDQTWGPLELAPGETQHLSGSYPARNPMADAFTDTVRATAKSLYKGYPDVVAAPVSATCKNMKFNPKLELHKTCVTSLQSIGEDGSQRVVVNYQITVRNTGDIPLRNVRIVDDHGTPAIPADDVSYGPLALAMGASQTFAGSYIPTDPTRDSFTDTARASADHSVAGYPRVDAEPASATCRNVQINPRLNLTKECVAALVEDVGGRQRVRIFIEGTAANTGDIALHNVVVYDQQEGFLWNLGTILPGESKRFEQTFDPAVPTASQYTDTITANATLPGGLGAIVGNLARAECAGILPDSALRVTKECVVVPIDSPAYPGRREIALRFRGTVTNTGTQAVRNLIIRDDHGTPADMSDDILFGPYLLAGGATQTFESSYTPSDLTDDVYSDTVHVAAESNIIGFPGANASISAECRNLPNNPRLVLTKNCTVVLDRYESQERQILVHFEGTVRNAGDVTLVNVTVIDDQGTPNNAADDRRWGPFTLAPGQIERFSGTYIPADPTLDVHRDTVRASADNWFLGFPGAIAEPVSATCKNVQISPQLLVTKNCTVEHLQDGSDMLRRQLTIRGTVRNAGNIELYDVVVYDDDGTQWNIGRLNPGELRAFQRIEQIADPMAIEFRDTVYAVGRLPSGLGLHRSANVTAVCKGMKFNPDIAVEKKCEVRLVPGGAGGKRRVQVYFEGSVHNIGDIRLRNVTVIDDHGTPNNPADDQLFGSWSLGEGESQTFSGSYFPADPTADYHHDTVRARGESIMHGYNPVTATASAKCKGIESKPALRLSKQCEVRWTHTASGRRLQVFYSGTVTNSGDTALHNVMVHDDRGTPDDASDDQTLGPYILAPGASQAFSSSYFPDSQMEESYSDTVRATAENSIEGFPGATAQPVTATCKGIKFNPKLVLTKECRAFTEALADGTHDVKVEVRGTVANEGDVELLNVIVRDSDGYAWNFPILNVGETRQLSRIYLPDDPTAEFHTDTIIGFASLPANMGPVTAAPATARCAGIRAPPRLVLEKNCYTVLENVPGTPTSRVRVNYAGAVRNLGNATLWSVIVRDDKGTPANPTDDQLWGPFTLSPGESAPFAGFYYPALATAANHSDTVSATARHIINGFPSPIVTPVTATCEGIRAAPVLRLTKVCRTLMELQSDGSRRLLVEFSGTVRNDGDTTMYDVFVTDDHGTPALPTDDQTWGPFVLTPGAEEPFSGSYYPANASQLSYADTVRATARHSIVGFPDIAAAPVTARCDRAPVNPRLVLTKNCTVVMRPHPLMSDYFELAVLVAGTVRNAGDIELYNVVVTDDDGHTWALGNLNVGETKSFDRSYLPADASADIHSDTVSATAQLPAGLGSVQAQPVTATCKGMKNQPELRLTKNCTVVLDDYENDGMKKQVVVYIDGTVRNTGNVRLLNVTVVDDSGTPNNPADDKYFGPWTLEPGEARSFSGSHIPANPQAATHSDTVRASAQNSWWGYDAIAAAPVTATCKGIVSRPALRLSKACYVVREPVAEGSYARVRVDYNGTVSNTGDVTLVNVWVWESADGGSMTRSHGPYTLAPGQSAGFSGFYYPSNPTAEIHADVVNASAENSIVGHPNVATDLVRAECRGIVSRPKLTLSKQCDAAFFGVGAARRVRVNFSGMVRNDGDTLLLGIWIVDDSGTPADTSDDSRFGPYRLAPGESQPFSGYYFARTPNATLFRDTVTAYANDSLLGYPSVIATPVSAECEGLAVSPTVVMTKNCTTQITEDPILPGGQTVRLLIRGTIANTGDIELENVEVVDDDGFVWEIGDLAIGEIRSFSRIVLPTELTPDALTDTIIARGNAILGFGPLDYDAVTAICSLMRVEPSLDIEKECWTRLEQDGLYQRVIVDYRITATNDGNTRLRNVRVTDDLGTPANPADDITHGPFMLNPGESTVIYNSYYPTNPMAAAHTDRANASSDSGLPGFPGDTDEDTAICPGIFARPSLLLTKKCASRWSERDLYGRRHLEIAFSGTVTNNGNVTLLNVFVTDDSGTPTDSSDDQQFGPWRLAPGESRSFHGVYTPADGTSDSFRDTVTARGENSIRGFPNAIAAPVSAVCEGIDVNPALVLEKECHAEFVGLGRNRRVQVVYNITVRNAGDVRLLNVTVRDDLGTPSTADDVEFSGFHLAPGETRRFSRTHYPTPANAASFSDTVTASAMNELVGYPTVVAAPVTATCPGLRANPALKLTKDCVVSREAYGENERIRVVSSGTVRNTGDIELVDIVVTDDDGTEWEFDYLGIGEERSFSKTDYPDDPAADSYSDTITARAVSILDFGEAVAAPVTAICKGIAVSPQLVLTKDCEVIVDDAAAPGIQSRVRVLFSGRVRNTGDVTLLNVTVIDDMGTPANTADDVAFGPFRLAPGAYASFNGSYFPSNPMSPHFEDTVTASGSNAIAGLPGAIAQPAKARCSGILTRPCLELRKDCVVVVEEVSASSKRIRIDYVGTLKNIGDVAVWDAFAMDDAGTPDDLSDDIMHGPWELLPGDEQRIEGSYYPDNPDADYFNDTLRARAKHSIVGFPDVVAPEVTAQCIGIQHNPSLHLQKECVTEWARDASGNRHVRVNYRGTVRNTGDVRLVNVYVIDDKGTPRDASDDALLGPFDLLPGEWEDFSGHYIAANPAQSHYNDTVRANGSSEIQGFPGAVAEPVTAVCRGVAARPALSAAQECETILEDWNNRKRVALHISGVVTNTGDIELENVIADLGWTTEDIMIGELGIGESYEFTRIVYPDNPTLDFFEFSFVASGDAVLGFGSVMSNQASARCMGVHTNPQLLLSKDCEVLLEPDGDYQRVVVEYSGWIMNTGNIDLIEVIGMDDAGTPDDPSDDIMHGPFRLAPGANASFSGRYYPSNPQAVIHADTITARGVNWIHGHPNATARPVRATCKGIKVNPKLDLEKDCETYLRAADNGSKIVAVRFSGRVRNSGDVELRNVMVHDDFLGTPNDTSDDRWFGPFNLKPGESATFQGEYLPTHPGSPFFMDTVWAFGENVIRGFPNVSSDCPVHAKCPGPIVLPKLLLTKECVVNVEERDLRGGIGCASVLTVAYSGNITNAGNIRLLNVMIRDDKGTPDMDDDDLMGPYILAPGETRYFEGSYYPCVSGDPRDIMVRDTVTATAESEVLGFPAPIAPPASAMCSVC